MFKYTKKRLWFLPLVCVILLLPLLTPAPAAALPAGFQEYLVMGDEYQIYRMFRALDGGTSTFTDYEMRSIVTVVATSNGQQVYYDHWEDGYEANIFTPVQTTTLIFGDGNTANGDSGFSGDTLTRGSVLSLKSDDNTVGNVITGTIDVNSARNPNEIRYDSRDRIVTTGGPVNVVHATWPTDNSWVGGAWEIYSFQAWRNGTSYTVPVGEDSYTDNGGDTGAFGDFEHVWLQVQAAEENTNVTIDNGTTTVNITLDQGDTYGSSGYINDASASSITIDAGTTVNADKPVQAALVTGGDGTTTSFQTRFFPMIPDVVSGTEYMAPVASTGSVNSQIYFFNPNDFDITIIASDSSGSDTFTVTANSARTYRQAMGRYVPADSAARLISSNIFWAVGSHHFSSTSYDWGYSLIPVNFLTSDYYVSWAPGSGEATPTVNGSPIHVTPRDDNTTFYVDYSPTDGVVDHTFTLNTLERGLVLDPDNDNTGMHIWTDNKPFMAVWGETPPYANTGNPYLDLGTTILPLYHGWLDPILSVDKTVSPQIVASTGGTVTFKLNVETHDKIMNNVNVTDTLPYGWTYVSDSTTITYPTGSTANLNPTVSGQNLSWNLNQSMNPNENLWVTFDAQLGSLGSSITEDWETGTYTGGVGWAGNWVEASDDGNAGSGYVQNTTSGTPHAGSRHLMIRGGRSISREVDLSAFIIPTLDFWRKTYSIESADYFNLDISNNGGVTWTRVLTYANGDNEGIYVNQRVDLTDYQSSNTAIRFIGRPGNGNGDYIYIDDVQIVDTATINKNVGLATGDYMGNKFEASDNAFVYVSDLSLDKTVDKDEAAVGEELVYTLAYDNSGTITTTDTYIRDVIPVNTTFTGNASAGGAYITASNTIVWGPLEVAPGTGGLVTFTVSIDDVPNGAVINNSATIDSDETAEATSNVVQTTALAPSLDLSKSGPTTAAPGDTITYTITYANNGGAPATGVIISDTVPVSTTYVAGSLAINTGSGWVSLSDDDDADAGQWASPTLGVKPGAISGALTAGETGQIRFAVTVNASEGASIGNVATIDSDQTNPQYSNLFSSDVSPLIITKASDRSIVIAGQTVAFTVTYANSGSQTLTDISLIDSIPDNTTLISGTVTGAGMDTVEYSTDNGQSWSTSFTNPVYVTDIRWGRASIISQTQATVGFQVKLDDPLPGNTTIQNQARITSTQTAASGRLYSNLVSIDTIDLTISKIANAVFVRAGDTITYTITYGNSGSVAAAGAIISDPISDNATYVPGSIFGAGADDSDPTRLVWNLGNIPANSGGYKAGFVVTVAPSTAPGAPIYNTASLTNAYDSASSNQVQVTVAQDGVTISPNRSDNSHDQGQQVCYAHTVGNTGNLSDTMELTATHSGWTAANVSFYQDNNLNGIYDGPDTPMTDTNTNGITDTGNLLPGQTVEILTCFTIPTAGVSDGDSDVLTVQATTWAGGALTHSSQVQDTTTVKTCNFITINTPADGLITSTTSISVTGSTSPNATVVITNTATGVTYTVQADGLGNFATTIILAPGSNPLDITSTNLDGDTATAMPTVTLINDPTPGSNQITIVYPTTGHVTSTLTVQVRGNTDPGATITLTNTATGATFTTTADSSGNFTITGVSLVSGTNPLEALSTDPYGNPASDSVTVLVDTTPGSNSLTITSPISGTTISAAATTVSGLTNPGSVVTVTLSTSGAVYTTTADNSGHFTIPGVILAPGSNTISVTSVDPSGNPANASIVVIRPGLITIVKTAEDLNGAPLHTGDLIRYAITVTNDHTATMTGVVVTDTLPTGVEFVSANPTQDSGPDTLVWNVGDLAASDTWNAVIIARVTTTTSIGGNVASVRSDQQNEQETDPVLLPDGGDVADGLSIVKTAEDLNGAPLHTGDLIRYAITVTNDHTATMTGVVVTDTLPTGVEFVSATPGGYTGPNPLVWNVGDLAASDTWNAVIIARVTTTTTIGGNVASVRSDQQNEQETDPVLPPGGGDVADGLSIVKTAEDLNGAPLHTGDLIRYAITVTNDHTATMTGVVVTDSLPAGVAFVSATPGGYTGPNPLVWNVGDLAASDTWTAVIIVEVDGSANPIGGNVTSVRSDQQNEQETDPVLPPGGGDVEPGGAPPCTCGADSYEPDDTPTQASSLTIGPSQTHDFCDDYTDWIAFTAQAGDIYTITTSSWATRTDTFLSLFDASRTLLAANDDYDGTTDYSSRVVWQAPNDGIYYVRVTNQTGLTGCNTDYDIWVEHKEKSFIYLPLVARNHSATAIAEPDAVLQPTGVINHPCPDSYEIDDTWQDAKPITDVIQIHWFDSDPEIYAADKDHVSFDVSEGRTITFTVTPLTTTVQTRLELYDELGSALGITGTVQLVWTPTAGGHYYLSVSPRDDATAFGCAADEAGYNLQMEMQEAFYLYLPLLRNSF